jgi:hypothetical protein
VALATLLSALGPAMGAEAAVCGVGSEKNKYRLPATIRQPQINPAKINFELFGFTILAHLSLV